MELSLPEFPTQPWPQAAFIATALLILIGLGLLAFPVAGGRILGLTERDGRLGGIGILRAAGGFLSGLALVTLLFDQPVLYAGLGVALAFAAFGRLVSLMSDSGGVIANIGLLLVQIALSAALMFYLKDVLSPSFSFAMPTEFANLLAFFSYCAIGALGLVVLFMPRISMVVAGLTTASGRNEAAIRAAGAFAAGVALSAIYFANQMMDFGMAGAMCLAVIGQILALILNRGNYIFAAIALLAEAAISGGIIFYVFGMM